MKPLIDPSGFPVMGNVEPLREEIARLKEETLRLWAEIERLQQRRLWHGDRDE